MVNDTAEGAAHIDSRGKRRWTWILAGVATITVYTLALYFIGGDEAIDALRRASMLGLIGAFFFEVVVTLTWPLIHRASLRAMGGDLRYREALETSMSAFTMSHSVPGGGAVGAAVAVDRMTRFGVPGPMATASVGLTGPITMLTIAVIGASGVAAAVLVGDLSRVVMVPTVFTLLVLFAIIGAVLAGLRSPRLGEKTIRAAGRLHRRLRTRSEDWISSWRSLTEHPPTPRRLAVIVAWSTVKWTADIAALALVFVAVGEVPRVSMLLIGFGVGQILGAIPATPGAVGFVEGGMIGVFTAFGIPLGTATTVAILYRVVETWLPALAGAPVLLRVPARA